MWQKITFKSIAWKWKSWCIEIIAIKKISKIEIIKKENHLKARTSYHLHLHWVVYRSIKHDAIWDCYQKHFVLETLATFGPTVIQNAFSILDKRKRAAVKYTLFLPKTHFCAQVKTMQKRLRRPKKKVILVKYCLWHYNVFPFFKFGCFPFFHFIRFCTLKMKSSEAKITCGGLIGPLLEKHELREKIKTFSI